jgi:hypothetical protein
LHFVSELRVGQGRQFSEGTR